MKILALDPSTKSCGVFDGITSETWKYEGTRVERFAAFAAQFAAKLLDANETGIPYDVVIYEYAFARGADATRCGWGMDGIIEALAQNGGCAVIDVDNSTLKGWARTNGANIPTKGKKGELSKLGKLGMIEFVGKVFGLPALPNDEADAVAIWHYAAEKAIATR